jgi:DNA-binding NarL/FixJ family response regulator
VSSADEIPDAGLRLLGSHRVLLALADAGRFQSVAAGLTDHGFDVVRGLGTSADLPEQAARESVGVVVLDEDFPAIGEDAIAALTRASIASVVLADRPLDDAGSRLLLAGASGYVYSTGKDLAVLADAVRSVSEGRAALDPTVAWALLQQWRTARGGPDKKFPELSTREREILRAMCEGATTQAIARQLSLSHKTIEAHKARIYSKLGARNQSHAVSLALQNRLLDLR